MKNQDLILIIFILVLSSCGESEPIVVEPPCGTDVYLEYPTNGEQSYEIRPYFQWSLGNYCGEEFIFQISNSEFFTNYVEDTIIIGSSYQSPHVYSPNQTKHWRIMNLEDSVYQQSSYITADYYELLSGTYQGVTTYKTANGVDSTVQNALFELSRNEFGSALQLDSVIIIFDYNDAERLHLKAIDFSQQPQEHRMSYEFQTGRLDYCRYESTPDDCLFHFIGNK